MQAGRDVEQLLAPFAERYGVSQFVYGKYYENGECILLSNKSHWVKHHLDQGYLTPAPIPSFLQEKAESFHIIPDDGPFYQARHDLIHMFNTGDGVDFIFKNEGNYEVLCYAFPVQNRTGITTVLNELDGFKSFSSYFKHAAAPLIKSAEQHKIKLTSEQSGINFSEYQPEINHALKSFPWLMHDVLSDQIQNKLPRLTNREIECIDFLKQGMTAKEIAKHINLSFRTVEGYVDGLRKKFQCKNSLELVIKLVSTV